MRVSSILQSRFTECQSQEEFYGIQFSLAIDLGGVTHPGDNVPLKVTHSSRLPCSRGAHVTHVWPLM